MRVNLSFYLWHFLCTARLRIYTFYRVKYVLFVREALPTVLRESLVFYKNEVFVHIYDASIVAAYNYNIPKFKLYKNLF